MGKQKKLFSILIGWGLVLITGCTVETTQVDEPLQESQESNLQIDKERKAGEVDQKDDQVSIEEEIVKEEPIAILMKDPITEEIIRTIYPEEMEFGINNENYKEELEKLAKELARGTDSSQGYDQRNTPDRIDGDGNIIKGQPQVILEETELVDKLMQASNEGGEVVLPLYVTESGYKPEDVAHLGEVVVASYTTYFNPSVTGRNRNIELSAQAIDNVIVGVGDHFSFNTTVGPSDETHGYQPAQEAINGKLVMGIGGGICQTSSTLFNAVDQLGVDYVEWHHHSVTVGYVPAGRDATVSYGGKDFRFLNTTEAPFLIKPIYGNGSLTVEIRTSKAYESVIKKGA